MERKLVSIRKVGKIYPIEGADFIECISIDGWELVAKKDEFKEGDLAVYFEIDSFLPEEPRYAFLKDLKKHQGKQGYRIKTIKLRKQISQGLALPLTTFPELTNIQEGLEVTELLNVIKYDNSIAQSDNKPGLKPGNADGPFPSIIPRTDEERIQNLSLWFEKYKDVEWEETLKLDGSSMTCYKVKKDFTLFEKIKKFLGFTVKDYHFGVCSRNLELKRTDNYEKTYNNNGKQSTYKQSDFWRVALQYKFEEYLPIGYAIQGELIGPNIQSNHEKVEALDYFIFNVYNINEQRYLTPKERNNFMEYFCISSCKHVPVLGTIKIFDVCPTVKDLLDRVKGQSMNKGTISEGRVYKSLDGTKSFKCINNEYLLKCEE